MHNAKGATQARSATSAFSELAASIGAGIYPKVTVYLTGGQVLSGLLCGLSEDRHSGNWAVLKEEKETDKATVFFSVDHVQAVRIVGFQDLQQESHRLALASPLAPLEFRRRVDEWAKNISNVAGFPLTVQIAAEALDNGNEALGRGFAALEQLSVAMKAMVSDRLGKETLRQKMESISLSAKIADGLKWEGKSLLIDLSRVERLTASDWEKSLSKLL